MTVAGAIVARRRGRIPQDSFRLGRWAWPASLGAAAYLALILLDIVLPGSDGVTVCRQLKDDPSTAAVPVALVSAYPELAGYQAAAHADAVLSCPFDLDAFLALVTLFAGTPTPHPN